MLAMRRTTLPSLTATSHSTSSLAVTTMPFLITKSKSSARDMSMSVSRRKRARGREEESEEREGGEERRRRRRAAAVAAGGLARWLGRRGRNLELRATLRERGFPR